MGPRLRSPPSPVQDVPGDPVRHISRDGRFTAWLRSPLGTSRCVLVGGRGGGSTLSLNLTTTWDLLHSQFASGPPTTDLDPPGDRSSFLPGCSSNWSNIRVGAHPGMVAVENIPLNQQLQPYYITPNNDHLTQHALSTTSGHRGTSPRFPTPVPRKCPGPGLLGGLSHGVSGPCHRMSVGISSLDLELESLFQRAPCCSLE